jgi:hypothetical protein
MKNFKTTNALNLNKSAVIVLAVWCQFLMSAVRIQGGQLVALEEVNGVLQAVQTVSSLTKGDYTLASEMIVFDKTDTRKYSGVELTDKYLMNVLQSGKTIYKHTYTRRFPNEKVPFKTVSTNSWEYNAGGTTLGDHKIEFRDYVCKQGGDYSGYDADLKVSFTIGVKHTTTSTPLFSNLAAKVTILNWDLESCDCREASVFNNSNGLPIFGTILPISWDTTFRANGRGQVRVFANLPSFTVNRSWGRLGSMAVTCE